MSIETNSQTTGRRGDDDFGTPPQSRVEMALMKETIKPQSRIEKLLLEGGGGTSNVQGIHLEINPLTFVMTMWLIDGDGEQVGTAQSIDLPIEATVVGMSYDDSTRTLILTLVSGATLSVPIGAIIYGLQPLIDAQHKLDASLVDDTQGRMRFTWVGTQAQYAIDSATMAAGTPVIITDDTDIDSVPTQESSNPVTSGGVYTALDGKQDTLTTAQAAAANSGITAAKVANYDGVYAVLNYDAQNHNGIYRGKDLTNIYTIEQMYERIHDGSFEDLYLGDYFTVSITTDIMTRFTGESFESGVTYYEVGGNDPVSRTFTETADTEPQSGKIYATKLTKTENIDLMFAAFDYYYNMGDTALAAHHAVLIPRGAGFATPAKMNFTDTTAGGYYGSDMHQITLPCYAKSLKTALGGHLLAHRTRLTTAINASALSMAGAGMTGAATAAAWSSAELQLMNEVQLYGSTALSSSWYDVGIDIKKIPVFQFINLVCFDRNTFWARSVASSAYFAYCNYDGVATSSNASYANKVRPELLFG